MLIRGYRVERESLTFADLRQVLVLVRVVVLGGFFVAALLIDLQKAVKLLHKVFGLDKRKR